MNEKTMKKIFLTMTMLVASITSILAADYTARAYITMDDVQLKLRESASFTPGITTYTLTNPNDNGISAYVAGTRYQQYGSNNIDGLTLEINAASANETLTFANVIGTLYLVDNVAKKCQLMANGESYAFTATVGVSVADRFYISKTYVAFQTDPVCYRDGELTVNGGTTGTSVRIVDMNDVEKVAATAVAADAIGQEIDITALNAGEQYQLILGDGVTAAPDTIIFRK